MFRIRNNLEFLLDSVRVSVIMRVPFCTSGVHFLNGEIQIRKHARFCVVAALVGLSYGFFLAPRANAQITIRQMAHEEVGSIYCVQTLTNTWNCTPVVPLPVTLNFEPTLAGSGLVLINMSGGPCFDNFGQTWYEGGPAPYPPPILAGITSLTCYWEGTDYSTSGGSGSDALGSIQFFEFTGISGTVGMITTDSTDCHSPAWVQPAYSLELQSLRIWAFDNLSMPTVSITPPSAYTPVLTTANSREMDGSVEDPPRLWFNSDRIFSATRWAGMGPLPAAGPFSVTATGDFSARCESFLMALGSRTGAEYLDLGRCTDCAASVGSPINVTNGNTYIEAEDYRLPGLGGGLAINRTWNSLWQATSPISQLGMFGDSWRSTYEEYIQIVGPNQLKYWRGDGSSWNFAYNGSTWVLQQPADQYVSLSFDSSTTLFTLTFRDGSKKIFNNPGYLVAIKDRNGNTTNLAYDASNRLAQVTDPAGRSLMFSYTDSANPNQVTAITDSVGTVATYVYDASAHLLQVTHADGIAIHYEYDANGLLTSVVDHEGKIVETHTYDGQRRGLTSARANGVEAVTLSYPADGTAQVADSSGNLSTYNATQIAGWHYVSGIAGTTCASCGAQSPFVAEYDSQGNRTRSVDALGHATLSTYDSFGDVLTVKRALDSSESTFQTWSYTYNSLGEVLTATDPLGNQTVNTYDSKGNLLTTTTAGNKTSFGYDTKGQLTSVTDPNRHGTTITYTPAGLIASIKNAQNHTTQFQYDARGNRTAVIDANNQTTSYTYDPMNRLVKITYPTSPVTFTRFAYDNRGRRITATDQNNKVTQYAYDDADRLVATTDANNGVTQYAYDNENNLLSITDAAQHQTTFHYDQNRRVDQTTFPSGLFETYRYDADNNLISKTDRNGQTVSYVYDYLNRLSNKNYPDSTGISYAYDFANRLTQVSDPTGTYGFTYDGMNRPTNASATYSFIPGRTFNVGYGYDAASNKTSMTDPQGAPTAYAYDAANRLTTITYPSRQSYNFTYDALNRRTKLSRPNAVTTNYQYDNVSRLLSVLHQTTAGKVTTTIDGATYQYDAAGNRTLRTDNRTNTTAAYSYDPLYELTTVVQGSTTTEGYTYDAVGNRLTSLSIPSYTYNNSNELTATSSTTFTYDNNGNVLTETDGTGTTLYQWDFENRLISVTLPGSGGSVSFRYDPMGRRIQKVSAAGTVNYVYDGASILEEVDNAGSVLARYTQGSGVDEPLAVTRSGVTSYYASDALGSITSLSSSSATLAATYSYDSFGNITSSTGTVANPFRFTGREYDPETGLYYYRARYFEPTTGRFLAEDLIGFTGGINFYAYVHNNPVLRRDPFGLWDQYTHDALIWNALKPCGVDQGLIYAIQQVSDEFDRTTGLSPENAYMHAMASPGQDLLSAWNQMNNFIGSKLQQASSAYATGWGWIEPMGEAVHTMMDATSPVHRTADDIPIVWPSFPNALDHGDVPYFSRETWANMTPSLMKKNIENTRRAYEQVTGEKLDCGCKQ